MEENQNLSKEPWLAVVLSSCFSGIGQIYAGRVRRGIILILIHIFLFFVSFWSWLSPKCDVLISIGLILIFFAILIWNLFDAHKCARKANSQDFESDRKLSKDPWLALFLSKLIPGLGHLYLRKWFLGILFIIVAVFILIMERKYPLLFIGLCGFIVTFVCFHAYILTPIRREKTNRVILIVCAVILCLRLLGYNEPLYKAHVADAFKVGTPKYFNLMPPEHRGGPAMKPTLVYEDRFLVRKSRKYIPKRGDVVVFKSPEDPDIPFFMRVAALAGETIQIKDGKLYIDGQKIQWRPIVVNDYPPNGNGIDEPYKVPEDCFYVLGDNSGNSYDSRYLGAIPLSDLIGKAYKIYWPLSRRGPIE